MNTTGANDWCISGVGLMPADASMQSALEQQNFLYTVIARDAEATDVRVVGSIVDYTVVAAGDSSTQTQSQLAVDKMTSPQTHIVSMTVTEKGYFNTLDGELDLQHPQIQHDIAVFSQNNSDQPPQTLFGILSTALRARKAQGLPPFTVLSCDNLVGNGNLVKKLLLSFCQAATDDDDSSLVDWIEAEGAFPCSMVDRITPASDPENEAFLEEQFGVVDSCPIKCEPHLQWIIEDEFVGGKRPAWESVGALMVPDVEPYELMKLRLLNSSHSALSYLSFLMGHRAVHKAMADPVVGAFVQRYLADVVPTVPEVPGIELRSYCNDLVKRFSNDQIVDQVSRLAMDGSAKLKVYVKPVVEDLVQHADTMPASDAKASHAEAVALAVAGWVRYLSPPDELGQGYEISDPEFHDVIVPKLGQDAFSSPQSSLECLPELLEPVFGPVVHEKFHGDKSFVGQVGKHLSDLHTLGPRKTVEAFISQD